MFSVPWLFSAVVTSWNFKPERPSALHNRHTTVMEATIKEPLFPQDLMQLMLKRGLGFRTVFRTVRFSTERNMDIYRTILHVFYTSLWIKLHLDLTPKTAVKLLEWSIALPPPCHPRLGNCANSEVHTHTHTKYIIIAGGSVGARWRRSRPVQWESLILSKLPSAHWTVLAHTICNPSHEHIHSQSKRFQKTTYTKLLLAAQWRQKILQSRL